MDDLDAVPIQEAGAQMRARVLAGPFNICINLPAREVVAGRERGA